FVLIQKYQKIKAKRMPPALPTHVLRSRANSFIFRFPLSILDLNGSARATWLREGAGGKPARAEAAGDAAAKKRL
ncbi:MAG TPA: hypothetical protein PK548_04215, partial [Bacteroidales bacterium]|nr:hypothetical protein [Bacteroidales bacterium]